MNVSCDKILFCVIEEYFWQPFLAFPLRNIVSDKIGQSSAHGEISEQTRDSSLSNSFTQHFNVTKRQSIIKEEDASINYCSIFMFMQAFLESDSGKVSKSGPTLGRNSGQAIHPPRSCLQDSLLQHFRCVSSTE